MKLADVVEKSTAPLRNGLYYSDFYFSYLI